MLHGSVDGSSSGPRLSLSRNNQVHADPSPVNSGPFTSAASESQYGSASASASILLQCQDPSKSSHSLTSPAFPLNLFSWVHDNKWRKKLLIVLVGLPARGKSYIAHKIVSFLRWRGYSADLFNVGKFRRQQLTTTVPQDAKFFDAANNEAKQKRDELAFAVLEQLLNWLENENGDVAVFDATNTTEKRRRELNKFCYARSPFLAVLFVESICDDINVLEENYLAKVRNSPDYKSFPSIEAALIDLRERVRNYEKVYEPIADDRMMYLKCINLNSKVIANRIRGELTNLMATFLMSIHVEPRPIFLVRAGHVKGGDELSVTAKIMKALQGSQQGAGQAEGGANPANNSNREAIDEQRAANSTAGANGNKLLNESDKVIEVSTAPSHLPFTISMGAHLDELGIAFSKSLAEFIANKSVDWWKKMQQKQLERRMNYAATENLILGQKKQEANSNAVVDGNGIGAASAGSNLVPPKMLKSSTSMDTFEAQNRNNKVEIRVNFQSNGEANTNADVNANAGAAPKVPAANGKSGQLSVTISSPNSSAARTKSADKDAALKRSKEGAESREASNSSPPSPSLSINGDSVLPLGVYTSTLPRAMETAAPLASRALFVEPHSALNMMDTGVCQGMSVEQIRERMPDELKRWNENKYEYRFPGGESQKDKARSLEPLLMELERQRQPVMIISHASTLQCLYGYFLGSECERNNFYSLEIPQHTVIELVPHQYGWRETRYDLSRDLLKFTSNSPPQSSIQQRHSLDLGTISMEIAKMKEAPHLSLASLPLSQDGNLSEALEGPAKAAAARSAISASSSTQNPTPASAFPASILSAMLNLRSSSDSPMVDSCGNLTDSLPKLKAKEQGESEAKSDAGTILSTKPKFHGANFYAD